MGDAGADYCRLSCGEDVRCDECPYRKNAPASPAGKAVWAVVRDCQSQLRFAGMAGVAVGLDFGAVMAVGAARHVDLNMLSRVLPHVEAAILIGRDGQQPEDDE